MLVSARSSATPGTALCCLRVFSPDVKAPVPLVGPTPPPPLPVAFVFPALLRDVWGASVGPVFSRGKLMCKVFDDPLADDLLNKVRGDLVGDGGDIGPVGPRGGLCGAGGPGPKGTVTVGRTPEVCRMIGPPR